MSTDNVTPIRTEEPAPEVTRAVEQCTYRAWQLRNLIDCVALALEQGECEDVGAAMGGLSFLAEALHREFGEVEQRVRELEEQAGMAEEEEES